MLPISIKHHARNTFGTNMLKFIGVQTQSCLAERV